MKPRVGAVTVSARAFRLARRACVLAIGLGAPEESLAGDIFTALFGGAALGEPVPLHEPAPPALSRRGRGGNAYCVRTCDGRHFPLPPVRGTLVEACRRLCPASETKVFYGASIGSATGPDLRSYSDLPNAFRYRKQIVPGCTCNGRTQFGLSAVEVDEDRTLKRGDIVVGAARQERSPAIARHQPH